MGFEQKIQWLTRCCINEILQVKDKSKAFEVSGTSNTFITLLPGSLTLKSELLV